MTTLESYCRLVSSQCKSTVIINAHRVGIRLATDDLCLTDSYCREHYLKGKYYCTADFLFILFGFRCFAYVELASALLIQSNETSQTGGQPFSNTCHYGECSLATEKGARNRCIEPKQQKFDGLKYNDYFVQAVIWAGIQLLHSLRRRLQVGISN